MLLEIINTSIVELVISLEIPANQVLKQIHITAFLPEGMTYAKNIGAKTKKIDEVEWKKDGIVDNSSDVKLEDEQLVNPSQINLLLDESISKSPKDIVLEMSLPILIYDSKDLINKKSISIEVLLSTDFKNYSKELIDLEILEGNINLYGHSELYFTNNIPSEGRLNFCFQMLNSLAPDSSSESNTLWDYQITFPLVNGLTLQYPFKVYLHKPHLELQLSHDFKIRFNYEKNAYLMTINHQNKLKGEMIYLEIPFTLDTSIIKNDSIPYKILQEGELQFFIDNEEIKSMNSFACSQIKILNPPPTYQITLSSVKIN